eukprot:2254251-Amphidinium_carterae.1
MILWLLFRNSEAEPIRKRSPHKFVQVQHGLLAPVAKNVDNKKSAQHCFKGDQITNRFPKQNDVRKLTTLQHKSAKAKM